MLERDWREWEEYDARLMEDSPLAPVSRPASEQFAAVDESEAPGDSPFRLESPSAMESSSEAESEAEDLMLRSRGGGMVRRTAVHHSPSSHGHSSHRRHAISAPVTGCNCAGSGGDDDSSDDGSADQTQSSGKLESESFFGGDEHRGAFEMDPYASLRHVLASEHANLPADELTLVLGPTPASLVLHQMLHSPEMHHAALASILGRSARRTVRLNGRNVPIPAYLRVISRLCHEVAEQSEMEVGEVHRDPQLAAPAIPKRTVGTASPDPKPDGIDVFQSNDPLPAWRNIQAAGISYILHRTGIGKIKDTKFVDRYRDTRAQGLIRGSYHFYWHTNHEGGDVQANVAVAQLGRLGPGDLPPALDFEEAAIAPHSSEPATAADWRAELEAYLDTIETKLGRVPLIYTRNGPWNSHLVLKHDFVANDFVHFGDYSLWVVHYGLQFGAHSKTETKTLTVQDDQGHPHNLVVVFDPDNTPKPGDFTNDAIGKKFFREAWRTFGALAQQAAEPLYQHRATLNPPAGEIPAPWAGRWLLYQYSPFTPQTLVHGHGFADFLIDFNLPNGGIHVLRGAADLDHTAPHRVGNLKAIAYTEPDGTVHIAEFLSGAWTDDVADHIPSSTGGALPRAFGDSAAAGLGNEQVIVYRSVDGSVHAICRNIAASPGTWLVVDVGGLTGVRAFDDPSIFILQNEIHIAYWGETGVLVHAWRSGGRWQSESFADRTGAATTPSLISGSPIMYVYQGAMHLVGRSRDAGHLFDFATGVAPQDLTVAAHVAVPAATYRPAVYARNVQAPRIVFRALRGHIWQIERDTLNATDLSAASTAPNAVGSPSVAVTDTVHIVFRAVDGRINEIFDDHGTWRTRVVCPDPISAADPTAFVDDGSAAASFRKRDGGIHIARFVNGAWTCADAN
jgi:GH25 family lysozyme M1 (1,4-beta-N-acetylmuramidase)